ncbi:hypothetical protein ANACOL_00944 [Anaerotruncus colihominis DSM 17241]|uniref:Uncharacterized protein n=1 Tax=Anaerotruncus colihominis DSM 17241 TaxID=445972 RepID=B0P854_9FIRM|nr:hypothetical protein ANACOL_00944 [Anaerotruncus colihominis DSM 17241]
MHFPKEKFYRGYPLKKNECKNGFDKIHRCEYKYNQRKRK